MMNSGLYSKINQKVVSFWRKTLSWGLHRWPTLKQTSTAKHIKRTSHLFQISPVFPPGTRKGQNYVPPQRRPSARSLSERSYHHLFKIKRTLIVSKYFGFDENHINIRNVLNVHCTNACSWHCGRFHQGLKMFVNAHWEQPIKFTSLLVWKSLMNCEVGLKRTRWCVLCCAVLVESLSLN